MNRKCIFALVAWAISLAAGLLYPLAAWADGWHNATLATGSIDQWLSDVKAQVPEVSGRMQQGKLKGGANIADLQAAAAQAAAGGENAAPRGGKLVTNLTPQQQALLGRKAADCMEILAFMDPKNIYPNEFPNFPMQQIPQYRQTAKELLTAMGPTGASVVVESVRSHLMGNLPNGGYDVQVTPSYLSDLVDVLKDAARSGNLTANDFNVLWQAAQGQKPAVLQPLLARLNDVFAEVDIPTLLEWIDDSEGAAAKSQLNGLLKKRLSSAGQGELLAAVSHPDVNAAVKTDIVRRLENELPRASVVDLLTTIEANKEPRLTQAAARELQSRNPTYAEVQQQIPQILAFTQSQNSTVVQFAQWHLANAFQRAPVVHCLYWLGQGKPQLNAIIWKQVDARIARADDDRRGGYIRDALTVLKHSSASSSAKQASLELLGRMKDRRAIEPLLEQLSVLPRDLWPPAGQTLKELTGQDFGPKAGDGIAEVAVAVRKWREWWQANGR